MRRVPITAGEKEMLWVTLERHRDAVVWKLRGLGDDDRPDVDTSNQVGNGTAG